MWESCFCNTKQPITEAILHRPLLPNWGESFEKVSVAMSVRLALTVQQEPHIHYFLVPNPSARTACYLAVGMLVGHFAHSKGGPNLPAKELVDLWNNDLLLVTPAISQSRAWLTELRLLGDQPLSNVWEITTLSRDINTKSLRPRVVLSNPGWVQKGLQSNRFGAIVIDATHPRTLRRLNELIQGTISQASLRIIVAPALEIQNLPDFGNGSSSSSWIWDPNAKSVASWITNGKSEPEAPAYDRTVWICDQDPEADSALEDVYRRMASMLKKNQGKHIPGLSLCWAVYHRLRQLTIALSHFEEMGGQAWSGNLKRSILQLEQVEGRGFPVWETDWPGLCAAVNSAYQLLLKRQEPAKFWVLASRVHKRLQESPDEKLRLVVSTEMEAELLAYELSSIIDEAPEARAQGLLQIVTANEEARRFAQEDYARTILPGPRPARTRYLDAYPCFPTEELAYPFEAELGEAALASQYRSLEQQQGDVTRTDFLQTLGFTSSSSSINPPSGPPQLIRIVGEGQEIRFVDNSRVDARLDIDKLAYQRDYEFLDEETLTYGESSRQASPSGRLVKIHFTNGEVVSYPVEHSVDVIFKETDEIQRYPVNKLRPGWNVVAFVDDPYDSLFKRLTSAVEERLSHVDRIMLELWREAKKAALKKTGGSRADLYKALHKMGLSSDYSTVTCWFREGEEYILAPQQKEDFLILAEYSGCYPSKRISLQAFEAIRAERGRNRAAGKALKSYLRAILSGENYDSAIGEIENNLGDIAAAVEVLEVARVQPL